MKKILLLVPIIYTLIFGFEVVSEAQTNPTKTQSEPDKNKPKIVALKSDEPAELAYDAGTARFLVNSEDTGGAWSLVEVPTDSSDSISPPHDPIAALANSFL